MKLYPLTFTPFYIEKVWGKDKIKNIFNRSLEINNIGESWEICHIDDKCSIVDNGSLKGKSIANLFTPEIMGDKICSKYNEFPLIVKYIDANDNLSVQVHPRKNITKNEIWYFITPPDNNKIILGVNKDYDINNILDSVNYYNVLKNQAVFIPSGAVHALTTGSFVLEIQEKSDITYRIFDWSRTYGDNDKRELHVNDAQKNIVSNLSNKDFDCKPEVTFNSNETIISVIKKTPFFNLEKWDIKKSYKTISLNSSFSILNIIEGSPSIRFNQNEELSFSTGETILIPAKLGEYEIFGKSLIINTYI